MALSRARRKPPSQSQEERDRISLGRIEAFLDQATSGTVNCPTCRKNFPVKDIEPTTLKAIEIRYSRLRPTLSAVEQSVPDPFAGTSRSELIAQLRTFLADPSIARELGITVAAPQIVEHVKSA